MIYEDGNLNLAHKLEDLLVKPEMASCEFWSEFIPIYQEYYLDNNRNKSNQIAIDAFYIVMQKIITDINLQELASPSFYDLLTRLYYTSPSVTHSYYLKVIIAKLRYKIGKLINSCIINRDE
jgi:hypothetical protein